MILFLPSFDFSSLIVGMQFKAIQMCVKEMSEKTVALFFHSSLNNNLEWQIMFTTEHHLAHITYCTQLTAVL